MKITLTLRDLYSYETGGGQALGLRGENRSDQGSWPGSGIHDRESFRFTETTPFSVKESGDNRPKEGADLRRG
jgi:hypothetical protein